MSAPRNQNALRCLLVIVMMALFMSGCVGPTKANNSGSASSSGVPTITRQPSNETVTAGQAATFSVAASGAPVLNYQWQKNGNTITGATSPTYTTPPTAASDNGSQFKALVSNPAGTIASNAATLITSAATPTVSVSSNALNFGNVSLSNSSSQNVTLTNTGGSEVTISNLDIAGAGFNVSGIATGLILAPGQTATFDATFTPFALGSASGSATIFSNASPNVLSLSGTGVAPAGHSVTFTWNDVETAVAGYNAYSSGISGGPYTRLNSTLNPQTSYTDSTVQPGNTYFYVVTAVDSNNIESLVSNEVSATVP